MHKETPDYENAKGAMKRATLTYRRDPGIKRAYLPA